MAIDPGDVRKILDGFEQGIFVRSTRGDEQPGWAIRLAPYLMAMARLQEAVEQAPPSADPAGPTARAEAKADRHERLGAGGRAGRVEGVDR